MRLRQQPWLSGVDLLLWRHSGIHRNCIQCELLLASVLCLSKIKLWKCRCLCEMRRIFRLWVSFGLWNPIRGFSESHCEVFSSCEWIPWIFREVIFVETVGSGAPWWGNSCAFWFFEKVYFKVMLVGLSSQRSPSAVGILVSIYVESEYSETFWNILHYSGSNLL